MGGGALLRARQRNATSQGPKGKEEAAASADNDFDCFNDRKLRSLETMEMYFQGVQTAAETWKIVQRIPNYEGVVGELLFKQ
jgi:hypothetical protein